MKTCKYMSLLFLLGLALNGPAWAGDEHRFARLVIFGDSLSDPGNLFLLTGEQAVPPYDGTHDNLLVPNAAYAVGAHHLSNGRTWIEQLARELELSRSAGPAYLGMGGQNYAIAGARAFDDPERPIDLVDQLRAFRLSGGAPLLPDALVVLQFGGNDLRLALAVALMGGDHVPVLEAATAAIGEAIEDLHAMGARHMMVALAPNLGRAPGIDILDQALHQDPGLPRGTVIGLATWLSQDFNARLRDRLVDIDGFESLVVFDLYQAVESVVEDPAEFGLEQVRAACVMPGVPPFQCTKPDEFLFWDGIHPTRVGHAALKEQALAVLGERGLLVDEHDDDAGIAD